MLTSFLTKVLQSALMFVALASGLFGLLQVELLVWSLIHYDQAQNIGIDFGHGEALAILIILVVVLSVCSTLLARRIFGWQKHA